MAILYRSVEVNGHRVVECPRHIWDALQSASDADLKIPIPAPINDPVFCNRRDKSKTYYTSADLKRLAKGEVV